MSPTASHLAPPPLAAATLPRPALTQQLLDGGLGRLTLVHGLPGSGKTVLLASAHAQLHAEGAAVAWLMLSPAHGDPARLQLDEAASRALLAILAPWFAEDGITLVYDQPTRWLAHGAAFDGLATASLDRVLQRDVSSWLPDKLQARNLHRLHSEMQMLLYTHPFNDARAARRLPPVNAFWVHGAGALPQPPVARHAPQLPDGLLQAALHEDWGAWSRAWAELDAGPVAQLAAHVGRGGSARLTLCGERSAMTWHTAPRGLGQRIQSLFRPRRFADVREQL